MDTSREFPDRPFDLICAGRVAVDFYSEQIGLPIEESRSFAKYLGGSSGNIAVGTARLGLKSSMLARIGDEPFGLFLRQTLEGEGVDTSHLISDPSGLTGLAILGIEPPDRFDLLYYRENCADMRLCRTDVDDAYLKSAKALLFNGSCLSANRMAEETLAIVEHAKTLGAKIVFDADYRPALWALGGIDLNDPGSVEKIGAEYKKVLALTDLFVGTEEEIQIAGGAANLDNSLRTIRAQCPGILVVKKGAEGCAVYPGSLQEPIEAAPFPVTILNVIGAGDAFLSGFLYAWFHGKDLEACAEMGNVAGAIVVTRHGCSDAMPSLRELDYFIQAKKSDPAFETDEKFETMRRKIHCTIPDK